MTLLNLSTCTPADLRTLLDMTSDLYGQHYLAIGVDGTLQFIPLANNPQPADFPKIGLQLCMYVPGLDDMPMTETAAIDDTMMNVFLSEATQGVADGEYGYF